MGSWWVVLGRDDDVSPRGAVDSCETMSLVASSSAALAFEGKDISVVAENVVVFKSSKALEASILAAADWEDIC